MRRRKAIDEIFHEDEPNGIYRGHDEIDRIAVCYAPSHRRDGPAIALDPNVRGEHVLVSRF